MGFGLDGFGVLRAIPPEELPLVVFVTAYDENAVRAFDANAVDYVPKPVIESRFRVAVERAIARLDQPRGEVTQGVLAALERISRPPEPERIPIRTGSCASIARGS